MPLDLHLHCEQAGGLTRFSFRPADLAALLPELLDHSSPVAVVGAWRRLAGQAGLAEALGRQGVAYVPLDGGCALAAADLPALAPAAELRWADAADYPPPGAAIDPVLATLAPADCLPAGSHLLFTLHPGGYAELLTDPPQAAHALLAGLLKAAVLAEFPDAPWRRPPASALAALLAWAGGAGCRLESLDAVPGPDSFLVMTFGGQVPGPSGWRPGPSRPCLRLLWQPGKGAWRVVAAG